MADRFAAARAYLRNADPVIAALIDTNPDFNLALRRAVRRAYGLDQTPSEQQLLQIAERWRPLPQPGGHVPVRIGVRGAGARLPGAAGVAGPARGCPRHHADVSSCRRRAERKRHAP